MSSLIFEDKSGRNFPNWFEQHEYEKHALRNAAYMKQTLIPAFVSLAKLYKEDVQNSAIKEKAIDLSLLERHKNILKQAIDNFVSIKEDVNEEPLKGIHYKEDFKLEKWSMVFTNCELCALAILQATINFLEQSSTIGEKDKEFEDELCVHFFTTTVDKALNEFYHNFRRILWLDNLGSYRLVSEFRMIHSMVTFSITIFEKITPLPQKYVKNLKTALFDVIENCFENEIKQKYQSFDLKVLIGENRCYSVLDGARKMVAIFITNCLKSLTSTLFHFCISKQSLTEKERNGLKQWKTVVTNIEEDVAAAIHKFALISEGKMRPYGFVMKAALVDSLPRNSWKNEVKKRIRLNLQECISVYTNWRFEFVTRYPRPIQAQFSQLSQVSNLFQSMVESGDDFKVIFQISKQLYEKVDQRLNEGKPLDDSSGPWNLLSELEKYFVCKELEYEVEAKNKCLPAEISTGTYKDT